MRIVHVAESINQGSGGEAKAVTQLAGVVAEAGFASCHILAFDLEHLGAPMPTANGVRTRLFRPLRPHLLGRSPRFKRAISDAIADAASSGATAFHLHSMWRFPLLWTSRACHRQRVPFVVSPHGALQEEALSLKPIRKRLFLPLFRRALARAAVLCATSEREAATLRELLPDSRIEVLPLGIDCREFGGIGSVPDSRTALFMSRLDKKKGLSRLLEAWRRLRPPGWTLTVAGPDEGGLRGEAERFVATHGLTDSVEFVGPVYGDAKRDLLARAEVFVLPTLGENFGYVVAEALAAGIPVLTTRGTPWEDLVTWRCGWWIDHGVGPLIEALEEALSLPASERLAMGERGRRLIREKYDRRLIADQLAALYRSLLADKVPTSR